MLSFLFFLTVVRALELPAPPPVVRTHVVDIAGDDCDKWLAVMERLEEDFPDVEFETINENIGDLPEGVTFSFPYSTISVGGRAPIMYRYKKEYRYAHRWLLDAPKGHFSLQENVSLADPWPFTHAMVVHVMSEGNLRSFSAPRLPEVAFVWSYMNRTNYSNTVIIKGLDGTIYQETNFNEYRLLHYLLPPVIPEWMLQSREGLAVFNEFAKREVTIVCDDVLEGGWHSLIRDFPETAFVQQRSNETNVTIVPSVWFKRRSVEFMIQSVGPDVEPWLRGIRNHTTKPWLRPSAAPLVAHPTMVDVTGDMFWDWIRENDQVVLYLYDGVSDFDIERYYEPLQRLGIPFGRMDLATNDHENLPLNAEAGLCLHYVGESTEQVSECNRFTLPTGHMEL
jgi:hypothetical protein